MTHRYGVLGVGALGSAIVTGLCDGVDDPPAVVLSPRSAAAAASLAERFETVTVAGDNQAVVDEADVVVVCLPGAEAGIVDELTWRADQVVVSAVAGLSIDRLGVLAAPAVPVRAVPMPAVGTRSSVTPVHPPLDPAVQLFDRLGGTLPVEENESFEAIFTALGTVAPFFEYLGVLAGFLTAHGLPTLAANQLVADTFAGILPTLADAEDPDFGEMVREYATPGGGNAQLTALMHESGVFDRMRAALDEVHCRFTSPRG